MLQRASPASARRSSYDHAYSRLAQRIPGGRRCCSRGLEELDRTADSSQRGVIDTVLGAVYAIEEAVSPEKPTPGHVGSIEFTRDSYGWLTGAIVSGDITVQVERNHFSAMTHVACQSPSGNTIRVEFVRDASGRVLSLEPCA